MLKEYTASLLLTLPLLAQRTADSLTIFPFPNPFSFSLLVSYALKVHLMSRREEERNRTSIGLTVGMRNEMVNTRSLGPLASPGLSRVGLRCSLDSSYFSRRGL